MVGATIGDALLGKRLGKRAMLLGALAQSIPDIDFISSFWTDTPTYLLAHRGFTHSILFDLLATIAFALMAEHYHRKHSVGYNKWILFFGLQITIHLFIDLFNAYGMGLLEPFSHTRISFDTLFVADPFFSVWMSISFMALLILKAGVGKRIFWQRFGIVCSSLYLFYCISNKIKIDNSTVRILAKQDIRHSHFFTTPTPLNNWLWYVVVKADSGFYVGYHSVFDEKQQINFHYFSKSDLLLRNISNREELQHLIRFSQGYYTVEKSGDTLVFNDLRFGQTVGWYNPNAPFVFHYYLGKKDEDNKLVVQRGRLANWDRAAIHSLVKRIAGN